MGLYQWANDVLLPSLYYTLKYNGNGSTSYEHGYLADMYSWRLGPPKLRQLRVNKGLTHNTIGVRAIFSRGGGAGNHLPKKLTVTSKEHKVIK